MKYINLTLDTIRLWRSEDDIILIPPSGAVAEVLEDDGSPADYKQDHLEDGSLIEYYDAAHSSGRISGFPSEFWNEKRNDMSNIYIVYPRIMHHLIGCMNLVTPDTGRTAIRIDGKVWAIRRWISCIGDDRITH